MDRPIKRLLVIILVLCALLPMTIVAQAPEPTATENPGATPTNVAPFDETTIGAIVVDAVVLATPVPGESGQIVHALMSLLIQPGTVVPDVGAHYSLVLHVQQGTLRVTVANAPAEIRAGAGGPIPYGIDDADTCALGERCSVEPGQSATLGPGNGISTVGGSFDVEAISDVPVIVQLSMVTSPSDYGGRCWICPEL